MLKTLGQTTWTQLEVGEIFAFKGCWCILEKVNTRHARLLAVDERHSICEIGEIFKYYRRSSFEGVDTPHFVHWNFAAVIRSCGDKNHKPLYQLPLSVQRLWKTE